MLRKILTSSGLDPSQAARLLGIDASIFEEWASKQRPIPDSYVPMLATVLGVDRHQLMPSSAECRSCTTADIAPAIWYKFQGQGLGDADRECVLLLRQLAYHYHQLEEVTENRAVGWEILFPAVRAKINPQAPPREQGRQAARVFRTSRGLEHGSRGIGEVFRGNIRAIGMMVIESPIPESKLEGCSFYVGARPFDRPCIFANTHHSTWFRRNVVLMHEVGHAIFDAESAGASVDLIERQTEEFQEERAHAFAQEVLVPKEVLRHISQAHGISWSTLSRSDLAMLVAETHVELRTVLRAAVDADLIESAQTEQYLGTEISDVLKSFSHRALSTEEYIKKIGDQEAAKWVGKRNTTIASRPLRLPVPYIESVLNALRAGQISQSKSAELLMIDEETFNSRFQHLVEVLEEG